MDYNYFLLHQSLKQEDETVPKETSTQSPTLVFLHEIVMAYLQELSYYLLQLKGLGITNNKIKDNVINALSGMIINVEYNPEIFSETIKHLYSDLFQAKDIYASVCTRNHLKAKFFKSTLKNPQKLSFSDAIVQGQKIFNQKYQKFTSEQMRLFELTLNILKSFCIHLVELRELNVDDEKAYSTMLLFLNLENSYDILSQKIPLLMKELVNADHDLLVKLDEIKKERYGQIISKEISRSTRPNKAILVSGTNLRELELLLEATKDKNIDIYTHGHMIMAHSYSKLKKHPHLVGHIGEKTDTYLLDFAEFPGAIFLTKHAFQKVENLYRSRIFTTDSISPKGVIKIHNNNFQPLIESALSATGFTSSNVKPPIKINIDESEILKKITTVAAKIEKGEIKHFFAIGVSNNTKQQKEYFETFLNLLNNDSFVISFSYTNNNSNVLMIESDYGFPFLYKALDILTSKLSIEKLNPNILFTRCEVHTLSNIIYLRNIGIKKLYFTDCAANMVNPALNSAMKEIFGVKNYTTPAADLKEMLMP